MFVSKQEKLTVGIRIRQSGACSRISERYQSATWGGRRRRRNGMTTGAPEPDLCRTWQNHRSPLDFNEEDRNNPFHGRGGRALRCAKGGISG